MDKIQRATIFRNRLEDAMRSADMNVGELARVASVDRSTLGQLLSDSGARLPNGHTLAEVARTLHVSADWLLGLSGAPQTAADVLEGSLNIAERTRTPLDENVFGWWQDAVGSKIRYVPASLPDPLKTNAVLEYEFNHALDKTPRQAIIDVQEKLAYARLPETDLEICMPMQTAVALVRGDAVWEGLDRSVREDQRQRMATIVDELYPTLRLYLFDARPVYSAAYTVFGTQRAAMYLGHMFLVFNTTRHVQALARHFDSLVRQATVQADASAAWLRDLK